jgi:hypothetical protein
LARYFFGAEAFAIFFLWLKHRLTHCLQLIQHIIPLLSRQIQLLLYLIHLVIYIIVKLFVEFVLYVLGQVVVEVLLWIRLLLIKHIQKLVILCKILRSLTVIAEILKATNVLKYRHISEIVVADLADVEVSKLVDIVRIHLIYLWGCIVAIELVLLGRALLLLVLLLWCSLSARFGSVVDYFLDALAAKLW